jgi:hypothetical protein
MGDGSPITSHEVAAGGVPADIQERISGLHSLVSVMRDKIASLQETVQGMPPQYLRDEVWAFAVLMEKALRKHDGEKGREGWKDAKRGHLLSLLMKSVGELTSALDSSASVGSGAARVAEECADISNFALMISDVSGGLRGKP